MKAQAHMTIGGSIALVLLIISFFNHFWSAIQSLVFFLWSVAVDFDHFIELFLRTSFGRKNLIEVMKASYKASMEITEDFRRGNIRKDFLSFSPFHTVEFLALIYILSLFIQGFLSKIAIAIFWSTGLHMLLDLMASKRTNVPRAWSCIYYFFQRKKMKKTGLDPNALLKEKIRIIREKLQE